MPASREHDVARFVADEQRLRDPRARRVGRIDLDDAHAVGEVVHHPGLGPAIEVRAGGDRDRLESDRNLRREREPARAERVDREAVIGRVHGEEPVSRGREREGAHVAALEVDERAGASGNGGHQDRQDGENACDHAVSPPPG